jgi:two-component sensor histidine kinase
VVRSWVVHVQPCHGPAVACQVAPALDREGRLIGMRWLLRDLTTQQHTQETIERRVRDLTRQLAHANGVIRAMQDQTELRMRELHHRMKNYLQVVSSLLDWHG